MCFGPLRRALFQHLNFQKCPKNGVFCTFWVGFLIAHLPRPAALASLHVNPPGPQIIGKTQCFATLLTFSRTCIFFLLTLYPKRNSEFKWLVFAIWFPRQLGYKFIWPLLWCHELNNFAHDDLELLNFPGIRTATPCSCLPLCRAQAKISACTGACGVFVATMVGSPGGFTAN